MKTFDLQKLIKTIFLWIENVNRQLIVGERVDPSASFIKAAQTSISRGKKAHFARKREKEKEKDRTSSASPKDN